MVKRQNKLKRSVKGLIKLAILLAAGEPVNKMISWISYVSYAVFYVILSFCKFILQQ